MGQLDPKREKIQDDLRGLISGDVRCDDVSLQLYASDASVHEIRPLGVVLPRSTADVVACVQYAAEKQIPIHARGAGTGLAGESLGEGLVLDFSKYLRRIIETGPDSVRVQPGIVHERLNTHLASQGRHLGPDPWSTSTTTMGSVIAVGGSGSRWLRYGAPRESLLGLRIVLADGSVLDVGREPLGETSGQTPDEPSAQTPHARKRQLVDELARLLRRRASVIQAHRPRTAVNRCGYGLWDVLGDDHLDLARLLVGSEGTLALITEVHVATQPLPRCRGVALLLFDSLEKATRAVQLILPHGPSACDLMDRRHVSLARETDARFDVLLPAETEAVLLVEMDGDEPIDVRERLLRMVDQIRNRGQLAFGARQAFDSVELELFWRLARKIQPSLYRMKGALRPVPVIEDAAVDPEVLSEFFVRMQNVLKRHEVTASFYCHAGQGQVHIYPFLDLSDGDEVRKMRRLADDYYREVLEVGGTIGAKHGCGLSRTAYIRRQYGRLYDVFREVKNVFDPANLFNPGKVVGDDPKSATRHLRPSIGTTLQEKPSNGVEPQEEGLSDLLELQLGWDPAQVAQAAGDCNGCGDCRTQAPDARMCPLFRILPAEEASPRAKANLIRGVLSGSLGLASLTSEEFKAVADLCVHCHMCAIECPAQVDVPRLMQEGKGAYVAANGLPLVDRILSRTDTIAAIASHVSPLVNWALGNRRMRWLMERTLSIAQGRKLPRIAPRSFLKLAARRRLTRPGRTAGSKVAYFVDSYANYHDPQLAQAMVAVLRHNGVAVFVPPRQRQSGTVAIACGNLDLARQLGRHNVALLAEAVRQGYHVVASEPAAAVCLKREYPSLVDDGDAQLVAGNTSEVCSYLWRMHTRGKLQLDFRPINATLGYHMPCRLKALQVGSPGENLLRLIPGLTVQHCEEGCSGMAGAFGLKRENYRTSLRVGWRLISRLRDPSLQAGATECSACKIQMEQGSSKPTVHPIKLLAASYGLMPELASLLTTSGKELIVT